MTRKDYVRLAAAIASARTMTRETLGSAYVLNAVTSRIGLELAEDNPRFDWHRFYDAAGYSGNRDHIAGKGGHQ